MIKNTPRQEFLASIAKLGKEFEKAKHEVEAHELALDEAMQQLSKIIKDKHINAVSRFAQDNPLKEEVNRADELMTLRFEKWEEQIKNRKRNTKFREKYGDSLLVLVYGKVKAGKSSLGNFVAYGHENPNDETINSVLHEPQFFMEAAAKSDQFKKKENALLARKKFSVGSTETTTEIQGFRVPGLTWIDSPGLHSANPENGDLSKSYADAADLIIYPMNSANAGRQTDLEEVAVFIKGDKPFIVIIPRCDEMEEDEDDDGNVIKHLIMKSPENRLEQVNYVQEAIIKLTKTAGLSQKDLLDTEVITLSLYYAQANERNLKKLAESGTTQLFEKLTKLTQSQGVSLKKETPLKNLRNFVDEVIDGDLSVGKLKNDLQALSKSMQEQRKQLEIKQSIIIGQVRIDLEPAISTAVAKHKANKNSAALSRECTDIMQKMVQERTSVALEEIIFNAQSSVNSAVKFDELKNLPEFKQYTETIELTKNSKKSSLLGGLGAGLAGLGAAVLTGGASLVVTIPAALAASAAGAYLGSKAGEAMTDADSIRVNLGDNTQEIIAEITKISGESAEKAIKQAFKKLKEELLDPIELQSKKIEAALLDFENTLKINVRPK